MKKNKLSAALAASALLIATTVVATPRGGGGGGRSMGGGSSMGRGGSSMGRGGSSMGRGASMGRAPSAGRSTSAGRGAPMARGSSMGRSPSTGRSTSTGRGASMGRARSTGRSPSTGRGQLSTRNGGGNNGNWNDGNGHGGRGDGNGNGHGNGDGHGNGHGGHGGGRGHGGWHGGNGWNWGWGWGWGWGVAGWNWGWGWGWGYPGYYGAYYAPYYGGYGYGGYGGYGGGYYAPAASGEWGAIKTDVSPEEARVMLDGRFIGTADDFDGFPDMLYLRPGNYRLEFQLEGFETQNVDLEARAGVKVVINNKLMKIPGAKQYGSYDTPEPEGGVQRFFGKDKEKNQPTAISIETDGAEASDWRDRDSSNPPASGDQNAPPMEPPPGKSYNDPPPADQGSVSRQTAPVPGAKARLVFRVEPPDAAIYVDDRFAGTGEELSSLTRGLQIAPGMHRIVVSRPGFTTESTQVDTEAGGSETVEISLKRP